MNKKIFAIIIVMFLLVGIVYADDIKLNPPPRTPAGPVSKPSEATPSGIPTSNILDDKGNVVIPNVPEPVMDYIRRYGTYADKNGVYFYKGNELDSRLTYQGRTWTVRKTEDNKLWVAFEVKNGGVLETYHGHENPFTAIWDYDSEGKETVVIIPNSFVKDMGDVVNERDFKITSRSGSSYSWTAGDRYGSYDAETHTLSVDTRNPDTGEVLTNYKTVLADGGIAVMDADGNFVARDADGNVIGRFSKGEYTGGQYYNKDGTSTFIPYSEADDGASVFIKKNPDTGKETTILIALNGDKTYIHSENNVEYAETIYHRDGSVTTAHDYKRGTPEYYENINKDGWLVSRKYGKVTYVVNEDQSITVYYGDGITRTWTEEEAESPDAPVFVRQMQTANEWNRFYTGRGAVSKLFGQIMGISDYSALSNALLKGKKFNEWRNYIDKLFSQNYLGIDYWASAICERDFHRIGDYSVAAIETPTGLVQFIGSIQAEKSAPMPKQCPCAKDETCLGKVCYKGTEMQNEYFYKITYAVTAPSDVKLTPQRKEGSAVSFSIQLVGEKSHWLFVKGKQPYFYELENRDSQSAIGDKAVIFYSSNDYNDIYIIFREKPRDGHGNIIDKIHNTISQSQSSYANWQASTDSGMSDTPDENDVPASGPVLNPEVLE